MPKVKIGDYDATAANNTDINSIDIDEGWAPSVVNNAFRELLSQMADAYAGDQAWDSITTGITAGSTQSQAGSTELTTPLNNVTVSGTNGDSVKLPPAVAGLLCYIKNSDSAQTIQIWPNTSDTVDGGSANAVDANALNAGAVRLYMAVDGTDWVTITNTAAGIGLGTGDSPQFTGIELGHASDTTIARASAGEISVEGTQLAKESMVAALAIALG